MVRTLADGDWAMDFMVQVQTDPFRMPIEDATVKWPESMSPYVTVARLTMPRQRFDSDEQLAFADVLRYNPWHSLAAHRPLGNSNRARRRMYAELAELRQRMNSVQHVEPTGDEEFPGSVHPKLAHQRADVPVRRFGSCRLDSDVTHQLTLFVTGTRAAWSVTSRLMRRPAAKSRTGVGLHQHEVAASARRSSVRVAVRRSGSPATVQENRRRRCSTGSGKSANQPPDSTWMPLRGS